MSQTTLRTTVEDFLASIEPDPQPDGTVISELLRTIDGVNPDLGSAVRDALLDDDHSTTKIRDALTPLLREYLDRGPLNRESVRRWRFDRGVMPR